MDDDQNDWLQGYDAAMADLRTKVVKELAPWEDQNGTTVVSLREVLALFDGKS